jgi:hypothetical protein
VSKYYSLPSLLASAIKRYGTPPYAPGKVPSGLEAGAEERFLAEALHLFDAEVVESLLRADGERQWQERRTGPARSYLHPWPDVLPGLGPRMVGPFTACEDCGTGSWARYGGRALCLPCAKQCR